MTKEQEKFYGQYIHPTFDDPTVKKENPLVLMAQACQNIGKDFSSTSTSTTKRTNFSSSNSNSTKQRKSSFLPFENKKSLKRLSSSSTPKKQLVATNSSTATTTTTTNSIPSFFYPPSPFLFDSFFLHHFNKTICQTSKQRSSYLMDSILSSTTSPSSSNLYEQFCQIHPTTLTMKYPSAFSTYFPPSTFYSSMNKL